MNFDFSRPRQLWPAFVAAVATLPILLALSSCGGGGTTKVAVDKWVDGACNLAADYKKVTDKQGDKLSSIDPVKDPKGAKKDVLAAFDVVTKAQGDFGSGLNKLGQPDLKSGADVTKTFQAHNDASKKALADAHGKLDKLDPNSKTFADDMDKILQDIPEPDFRAELQKVADKQSDAQEVMDGIDANSDCADIYFSSSGSSASATPSPARTPVGKTTPNSKTSPIARTTVKPNASRNERWIVGLCVATQSWVDDVESLANGLDVSKAGNDPQKLKTLMVTFLQDTRDRSQQFKQDVDKLQPPDIKDGVKVQTTLSNAFGQVVTVFDQALKDAKALDGSNAQKLSDGLTRLGDNLSTAMDDVSGAFDEIDVKYDTSALGTIANTVPECSSFFR